MSYYDKDDEMFVWMPPADILKAEGAVNSIRNAYWLTHPYNGCLMFIKNRYVKNCISPCCNNKRAIIEMIQNNYYPWANIAFIPLVLYRDTYNGK